MDGGIEHVAKARVIALGMDVELQLEKTKKAGFQPVLFLLRNARGRAIEAMTKLALVDPTKAEDIRRLQLEIMLFDDMVESCREAVQRGHELNDRVTEEEREEINSLIMNDWAAAERLGVTEVNDR